MKRCALLRSHLTLISAEQPDHSILASQIPEALPENFACSISSSPPCSPTTLPPNLHHTIKYPNSLLLGLPFLLLEKAQQLVPQESFALRSQGGSLVVLFSQNSYTDYLVSQSKPHTRYTGRRVHSCLQLCQILVLNRVMYNNEYQVA